MVSEKIRKVRRKVQGGKQAARDRVDRAKFQTELRRSKVRESGPVQEAKETKRELGLLGKEVGGPIKRAVSGVSAAGKRAQDAIESLDEQFGDPARADRGTIRELKQSGAAKGVKAGDKAFENRIKREVKQDRLESLENAEADRFGLAGEDFGVDLEVVDDFERGEQGGMGQLGFDVLFDDLEGPGLLGEGDPDDLTVVGEDIDRDLRDALGEK